MEFLNEYALFLAKAATAVLAAVFIAGMLASLGRRGKAPGSRIEVTDLNREYEEMERALCAALLPPKERKQKQKSDKKQKSAAAKQRRKEERRRKRVYVLDFAGDIHASAVASLRREISALLTVAESGDEVVVRLESGGGVVHGYGLAASQLRRIRERGIALTVSVDKIAASGGYMMACVANQIIAAPFAVLGSIGVLAQIPNLHRFLKKRDVDFEQLTAGEFKRTLTLFGENTDKAREKMQQELEEMHGLFKEHVKTQRPNLNIDAVATGEHWLGARALELGLVDKLQTSDDYLMAAREDARLVRLRYAGRKKFLEKLAAAFRGGAPGNDGALERPLFM
ncbi:MAG: protease SohB [Gammaproteobacteria bacterium]|nr:protease SohB [Gammaproteobacteria bacterium]MDA7990870.1 protease SohB [Gammaproteobacteria bacterium]MDA8015640.1 protease SohB [Gammaproteobacteria bacterium]